MRNGPLRFLGITAAAGVLLIAPLSFAMADEATDAPTPTLYSTNNAPSNPPAQPGDDNGRPEHRVHEEEHGLEGLQLSIVAAAIIIAAGIAIGISRSRSTK